LARSQIHFKVCRRASAGSVLGQRHRLGLGFQRDGQNGELSSPIVIGRDHLELRFRGKSERGERGDEDGSDAVSDWPCSCAAEHRGGATWVSIHHAAEVGMGYSQHGRRRHRRATAARLRPGAFAACSGRSRHRSHAPRRRGYQIAIDCAREQGLNLPMIEQRLERTIQ